MGKREHTLSFRLGDTVHEGTLAQVQEQLDAALQSTQLARTIFFGQHGGGGLLDKTDAALKAELQALLPLELWESVRETARLQVRLIATDCDRLRPIASLSACMRGAAAGRGGARRGRADGG
jgi:hypothetical protein